MWKVDFQKKEGVFEEEGRSILQIITLEEGAVVEVSETVQNYVPYPSSSDDVLNVSKE